jgi:ribA/ribD-fused uncharacterized protein
MDDQEFIGFMLKDWYVFDSFAPFQIEWRGKLYPTAEHAYQAAHFSQNPELAEQVRTSRSPKAAQELANKHSDQDDPDWKGKKLTIMEDILSHKLDQHSCIREVLTSTGNKPLVETNDNDEFWGWGKSHAGQNHLGKLWMKLREDLHKV